MRVRETMKTAAFLMAGYAKLSGKPMMLESFEKIGLGQWFRYLTVAWKSWRRSCSTIPAASGGALLLACTMIGAFLGQLPLIGGPPLPALVACIGHLDIRAQAEVLSAPRSATPRRESQCRQSAAVPSTEAAKLASVCRTDARKECATNRGNCSFFQNGGCLQPVRE